MRGLTRRALGTALVLSAVLAVATPAAVAGDGWRGVTPRPVEIAMAGGWTAGGELTTPARGRGPFPAVVLYHGSGLNDRDQTLPVEGGQSTFRPIARDLSRHGYAVLRFDKRGVVAPGPVLSDDPAFTDQNGYFGKVLADAEVALAFAAAQPEVDPERIYLLGHSEGTITASLLAADPAGVRPAGVIAMGVAGLELQDVLEYQLAGVRAEQLHVEFDVDGDGALDLAEITDGFLGQPPELVTALTEALLSGGAVSPQVDANGDGRVQIDAEFLALAREAGQVDAFPEINPPELRPYVRDLATYDNVTEALPRYDGPSLLLNGANDRQTVVRGALRASAAVTAAGRQDHELIVYPDVTHFMSVGFGYAQVPAAPDHEVITDIRRWLDDHTHR